MATGRPEITEQLLQEMVDAIVRAMKENSDEFADESFGFHAKQPVEKGLKAWIATLDGTDPLTHAIAHLADERLAHESAITGVTEPSEHGPSIVDAAAA